MLKLKEEWLLKVLRLLLILNSIAMILMEFRPLKPHLELVKKNPELILLSHSAFWVHQYMKVLLKLAIESLVLKLWRRVLKLLKKPLKSLTELILFVIQFKCMVINHMKTRINRTKIKMILMMTTTMMKMKILREWENLKKVKMKKRDKKKIKNKSE